jgi:hypothetical protein
MKRDKAERTEPDYIGHMAECEKLGILHMGESLSFGLRRIGTLAFNDVDAYRTESDAVLSLSITAKYRLPAMELVRKIDGNWCNCY